MAVVDRTGQRVGGVRSFLPAVEGMRACAAIGVVVTHVAFQTGHASGVDGRLFGRFDLAVAVFFALSGFLLWRGHAGAARDLARGAAMAPRTAHYVRSRVVRIMPAYVVAVVVILCLLPDSDHASRTVWLANLTLTQIYVPLTLTGGLTQMWSLSVEVSFYLALPIMAWLARRLPTPARVPTIAALAALSWVWAWLPFPASWNNPWTWPPAFFSWFAAGMLLAELVHSPVGWPHRLARRRVLMAVLAVCAYLVAASPLAGPAGLAVGSSGQYAVKMAMGAVVAFALVAPLVLDRPRTPHRLLGSTAMVTFGRWSYGLFIWHLAALDMVFPVLGIFAFSGQLPKVLVLTLIFGFAIAAVSYALVESPCREALRRWEKRERPAFGRAVSVDDPEADAIAP
jgi:peptidoglycan/LPS O-acetylase OafA/YrhL